MFYWFGDKTSTERRLTQIIGGARNNESEENMKYRVSLEVDKEWVKNFDLVIEAEDEQEAEAEAMVEVKQNLGDYLTAYAEEEEEK